MAKDPKFYYFETFNKLIENNILSVEKIIEDEIMTKQEIEYLRRFIELPRLIEFLKINYYYGHDYFDAEKLNKDFDNPIFKV